jgi:hypothetical protein
LIERGGHETAKSRKDERKYELRLEQQKRIKKYIAEGVRQTSFALLILHHGEAIIEPPESKTLHLRRSQERVEAWPSGHTHLLEDAALILGV